MTDKWDERLGLAPEPVESKKPDEPVTLRGHQTSSGNGTEPVESEKLDEPVTLRGHQTSQIDGNELLAEIREWFRRYISTMTDADLDLLTLWAAHTHLVRETYTTPRLLLDSPVPGSGKTTCLEHLQRLCWRPVQMASLSSPALLTRMLDAGQRTILIDEADRSLNPDKEGIADLHAVLNSGYKRGGTRPVLVPVKGGKWATSEMPTFAAVAMAGNNPNLPEDTRSRTIRLLLLPDLEGTVEESDWELIEQEALNLHNQLITWANQVRDQVRTKRPPLPEHITGRFREKWSPLKRVAFAAGGRWSAAVDEMAKHDREEYEMDKEDGLVRAMPAVLLLGHIREVWPDDTTFLATTELIDLLVIEHPGVWGEEGPIGKRLTPQRLGKMLVSGYKIRSDRETNYGPRGYRHAAFTRAWSRVFISPSEPDESTPKVTGSAGSSGLTGSANDVSGEAQPGDEVVETLDALAERSDRCHLCGWHPATQGHAPDCSQGFSQ